MVFNLAVNFLHDEAAAEDATQEVFLKATEKLSLFRGDSSLSTWIYRIARNHLIDVRRRGFRDEISFELFERDVSNFAPFGKETGLTGAETAIYVAEIKVGCTKAMLQCLDETDRFAFILGKVFGFPSREGAAIMDVTETAYRQRLSRASRRIADFVTKHCGLANGDAPCSCERRIGVALARGRIRAEESAHESSEKRITEYVAAMEELDSVAAIFRDNPYLSAADRHTDEIRLMAERVARAT